MGQITLEQVTKSFGQTEVIPPLDLTIHDGEFTVFVGPSGCGKSTLLRLIAGLEDISSGTIKIDGQDATNIPPAKRGLAMVFQSYALYPHMSVRKNIAFPMRMANIPQDEQNRRIEAAAKALNLTDYLDRRPGQLSGGQRQRVAIGRAIVREPAAFLFDEPLSNLDAALRVGMRLEISELHKRLDTTMIYVTHDQVEAMTMADKIVVLQAGVIEQVGSPLELYKAPRNKFVAGFIGSPKMNLIEGEEAAKHNAHTIGIRPEHITVAQEGGEWSGVVGVAEHLGSDTFFHIHETGLAETITVRADGEVSFNHGDRITLSPRADVIHRFDANRSEDGMTRLAGKTALITGAARGIGRAFAEAYVREGARVAIADINIERAKTSAAEIGDAAVAIHMDVTDQASIDAAVAEAVTELGVIDILINNAALFTAAPIVEITREDYQRVFDINVAGPLFTLQAVARHMIARGKGGKIINMASQAGRRGEPLVAVYCATKAAVISLTQSAALNLIAHGINVNAIAPGVVDGEHWDGVDAFFARYEGKAPGQKKQEVGDAVPYGRMGRAEDLTGMAVFLASDEANYVVAQCYNVDGGQWMS